MAKKKGEARILITLACGTCKMRTYHTTKNRKNDPDRLELNKYCPKCRVYTPHRESK